MKGLKRLISMILVLVMIVTIMPQSQIVTVNAKTVTSTASLPILGYTNNPISIGAKEQDEKWLQTKLDGNAVFCLDLGKTCRTGDKFSYNYDSDSNAWVTYTSESSNAKRALYAKIGYWYSNNKSKTRWIYAQALFWSVAEGYTSESQLKAVITRLNNDPVTSSGGTVYKSSSTASALYKAIFEADGVQSIEVREWTNEANNRQKLLEINKGITEPDYLTLTKTRAYRQRVTVYKKDEFGNPLQGAEFKLTIKNVMELDNIKMGNGSTSETVDDDSISEKASTFDLTGDTGKSGLLYWKITYSLESEEYGYVKDSDLEKMNADEKAAVKAIMDEKDISYASNLTKDGAENKAESDLDKQFKKIKNKYELKEVSSGSDNILVSDEYASGKTFTLNSNKSWVKEDGAWPETTDGTYGDYSKAYIINPITNEHKYYTVTVNKKDGNSSDGKAYGDATLAGAKFKIYTDKDCTKLATVYDSNGNSKGNPTYTTNDNASFETDYLVSGEKYYLKEVEAPVGYQLNTTPTEISETLKNVTIKYTRNVNTKTVNDAPILGKINITKYHSTGKTGELDPEQGATFQIYLSSKGSYDACSEYERDIITIDESGEAKSKDLYYGTYTIHQTKCGDDYDTELIADQEVTIDSNEQVVRKVYVNNDFTAYLRIVKKLKETTQTVLKAGTSYEIYKVDSEGNETKVSQSHSDGHSITTTDVFTTDKTGLVETYNPLPSGTYRIYEVAGAEGTHKVVEYVEITLNSKNDSCKQFTDSEGNVYYEAEAEYINDSTRGKFSIDKTGEMLSSYDKETGFVYKETNLNGVEFKIYAKEDIATADGQDTVWFNKGDLVATVVTGGDTTFTSDCNGICEYKDGYIYLPLGSYIVEESNTVYGYLLPDKEEAQELQFNWIDFEQDSVSNSTSATDENSILHVKNERAKATLSISKLTEDNLKLGVPNTAFDLYTKDDIYNKDGEVIVEAGTQLDTIITDENGYAKTELDLPIMSEGYTKDSTSLNSGDYYFVESSISNSYFIDTQPIAVHLEYKDANTKKIEVEAEQINTETSVEIDKLKMTDSTELNGASLEIKDSKNNVIISWVSGDKDSVKIADITNNLDYENLYSEFTDKGNLVIHGLLHDEEYTLMETRPADGYVTADSIKFMITSENETVTTTPEVETTLAETTMEATNEVETTAVEESTTEVTTEGSKAENSTNKEIVNVKNNIVKVYNTETAKYEVVDKVVMKDDTTKVYLSKQDITNDKELKGCKLEVKDTEENIIDSWTSSDKPHYIEAVLVAGKEYTLTETKPADGFTTATSIKFVVRDTGNVQTVTMKDEPSKVEFSKTDITGEKEIPGCKITVTRKSTGEKIDSWTSTKESHIITGKLIVGETYVMKETRPAEGYASASDVEFTVEDNPEDIQHVTMIDETIKVKIIKVDSTNVSKKLANAEFKFTNSTGKQVATAKTGSNGEVIVEGKLVAGKSYIITETKAPDGYELTGNITYKVKDTGDIQVITIKDKPSAPKTGIFMKNNSYGLLIIMLIAGIGVVLFGGKKKKTSKLCK